MADTIGRRPGLLVDEITKHEVVWRQQEQREPEPAFMSLIEENTSREQHRHTFEMKQKFRFENDYTEKPNEYQNCGK
jgi:hypothetical protein